MSPRILSGIWRSGLYWGRSGLNTSLFFGCDLFNSRDPARIISDSGISRTLIFCSAPNLFSKDFPEVYSLLQRLFDAA